MSKVEGFKCDVCNTYGEADKPSSKPVGWMVLVLPETGHEVRSDDRARDICSAKCLVKFGRERQEAEGTVTKRPKINRSDSRVLAAYEESGLTSAEKIRMSRRHNADHGSDPDPDCIPCQVLTDAQEETGV